MPQLAPRARITAVCALAIASMLVAAPAYAGTTAPPSPTTSTTTSLPTASATTALTTSSTAPTSTAPTSPPTASAPTAPTASPATTATSSGPTTLRSVAVSVQAYGLSAAAGPATSIDPAALAGGYIVRDLAVTGGYFVSSFDGKTPDYGLTLDAVLALDAAGVGQSAATTATKFVADNIMSYVTDKDFGPGNDRYVGGLAKSLNAAVAQKVDPTAFGGLNLVAELQALEQPNGRFVDKSTFGDYANIFGQSFAVLGLTRAGAGASKASLNFLALQQCPNGGFRLTLGDAQCTTNADADADSTALAVQALIAAGSHLGVVKGLDYLVSNQAADGSFGGGKTTQAANANSTGLAGQALLAGGRSAAARNAVNFLRSLQYGCSSAPVLRGGVAYNNASYTAQVMAGSSATARDQDRRSTTQAALALAGTPLGVVTASGAYANAPSLVCPSSSATTPTTPATTTPTVAASGSGISSTSSAGSLGVAGAGSLGVAGAGRAAPVADGTLAATGADLLMPVGLALVLLVLGSLAVIGTRRRHGQRG